MAADSVATRAAFSSETACALMALGSVYAKLYELQLQDEPSEVDAWHPESGVE